MGGSGGVAAVGNVVDDVLLVADLPLEIAVDLTGGIVQGHPRGLVHNNVLERLWRPAGTFERIGRVGNGLLDIDSGNLDRIRVHDGAAMLFIRSFGDAVVGVAAKRIQLKLVEANPVACCLLQDDGGARIPHS